MFRQIIFLFTLGLTSVSLLAREAHDVCILDHGSMPDDWQWPGDVARQLGSKRWSTKEQNEVDKAVANGSDEMIAYFKAHPTAVTQMWDDSVEALIQITYASTAQSLDSKLREAARNNLVRLVGHYENEDLEDAYCADVESVLPLAIFAEQLLDADDVQRRRIMDFTNAAFQDCESLKDITGLSFANLPDGSDISLRDVEELFDFHLWSLWLLQAEHVPELTLPSGTTEFATKFWSFVKTLEFESAASSSKDLERGEFLALADLATHIAHIPTNVHRFPLFTEDHPGLYKFLRKNFFKAWTEGDLDLFASFVDSLRQYGCTPDNDIQVRAGTRLLMRHYIENDGRWINTPGHRDEDDEPDHYKLIHRPWTALLGLRHRRLDTLKPGSFGAFVRRKLSLRQRQQ